MRLNGPLLFSLASIAALSACAGGDHAGVPQLEKHGFSGAKEGVDHVLIWTRDVEQDMQVLRDRLGFRLGPRFEFPDQVANRVIYFRDQSFLELLHFTVPVGELSAGQLAGVEFLTERDGSNGFGIRVASLEARASILSSAGMAAGEPSPATFDPDGPDGASPSQESPFRTLEFSQSPLPGLKPFFVSYPPWPTEAPEYRSVWEETTTHPNTAQRLSAVWIIGPDPEALKAGLRSLGFSEGRRFPMPRLAASGRLFSGGRSAIIVVEPAGEGPAAEALRLRGPHVLGISVEVADLTAADALVRRGYAGMSAPYAGAFGRSFMAPSQEELGVLVEFHGQ